MNDLELLKHAKSYIDKMANGMNPLTNEPVPETDLLNDIKISRCLFYVSGILQGLLNNDQQRSVATRKTSRKSEFSITADELARYEFSQEPLTISELTHRINTLVDLETMKPLHYRVAEQHRTAGGKRETYRRTYKAPHREWRAAGNQGRGESRNRRKHLLR